MPGPSLATSFSLGHTISPFLFDLSFSHNFPSIWMINHCPPNTLSSVLLHRSLKVFFQRLGLAWIENVSVTSSTPHSSGKVGLNLALGLIASCCGRQSASWRPACSCCLGWGSMSSKANRVGKGSFKIKQLAINFGKIVSTSADAKLQRFRGASVTRLQFQYLSNHYNQNLLFCWYLFMTLAAWQ